MQSSLLRSSFHFKQFASVQHGIVVTHRARRKSGTAFKANIPCIHSGLFLVFCGDLSRVSEAISMHGKNQSPKYRKLYRRNRKDAALAAQMLSFAANA